MMGGGVVGCRIRPRRAGAEIILVAACDTDSGIGTWDPGVSDSRYP
jgi:hypothetical protein